MSNRSIDEVSTNGQRGEQCGQAASVLPVVCRGHTISCLIEFHPPTDSLQPHKLMTLLTTSLDLTLKNLLILSSETHARLYFYFQMASKKLGKIYQNLQEDSSKFTSNNINKRCLCCSYTNNLLKIVLILVHYFMAVHLKYSATFATFCLSI